MLNHDGYATPNPKVEVLRMACSFGDYNVANVYYPKDTSGPVTPIIFLHPFRLVLNGCFMGCGLTTNLAVMPLVLLQPIST